MIDAFEKTFSFAEFEIDAVKRRFLKSGQPVALNPKAFDLLLTLIENRGRILGKEELLGTIWANQFVEENNLTVHISALRKILGEKKGEHQFIVTVPGKGYKFVHELNENDTETEITIENHSFSRIIIEEGIERNEPEIKTVKPAAATSNSTTFKRKYLSKIIYISAAVIVLTAFLSFSFWKSGGSVNQFSLSKLTTSGKVSAATITPDGKYAVFSQIELDGESLWLRHIATGSQQKILPTKPIRFVGLAVAPDGNTIYATVFSPALSDPQIWRVPLLGGAIEEVGGITTGAAVSFSPDGNRIAFTESHSGADENQLLTADANGSNKKILLAAKGDARSLPNFNANPVAWSPDGGAIACSITGKNAAEAARAKIVLVNPFDGGERVLSDKSWDFIEHLTWIDAENLAFIAYTSEPWRGQIWTLSKRTGAARQITNDLNNYAWLGSANGNLLTVQTNQISQISVADFDERNARLEPRAVQSESGQINHAAWASDGAILYSSGASGKSEIWRIETNGANPVQLSSNANVSFGFTVSPVDGSIVFSAYEMGKYSLKLMNAEGKNIRPLTDGTEDVYPNFTADGQSVIFQRGINDKLITLWRVSLADKNLVQITKTHSLHPAVSPDGLQTAYYFMDADVDNLWRINLISNADGANLGKLSFPTMVTERRMRWHPGGKFIGQILYEGENINLLLLSVNSGVESKIVTNLGKGEVNWFEWSRDGRQIIVSATTKSNDIVLLSR